MTLSLALDQNLEQRLEHTARACGMEPSEFVLQVLTKALSGAPSMEAPRFGRMTDEEWHAFSEEWTEAHRSIPILPDEALTRESIYGDHF